MLLLRFLKTLAEFCNLIFFYCFSRLYARSDVWHNQDLKSGDIGYGFIHYSLIRVFKPKDVLCVGSRFGYIPMLCALACKHNGVGVVHFVDAGLDQENDDHNHWGGVGFWKRRGAKRHLDKLGVGDCIRLYVMTTHEYHKSHPGRSYQYVYIDGDHSYAGVMLDYKMTWPKLSKGGLLLFHDIYPRQIADAKYGVWRVWSKIKRSRTSSMEFPGKYGLGLVQK